jgi:hypothetical protein
MDEQSFELTHEIALNIDVWTLKTMLSLEMISISAFLSRYLAERTGLGIFLFPAASLISSLSELAIIPSSDVDAF